MPTTTPKIIKFLNSKTSYELEVLDVKERTQTILEVKRVLTKRNLLRQLEEKCHELEVAIGIFFNKNEPLREKWFPSLYVINNKLVQKVYFMTKIMEKTKYTTKLSNIQGSVTWKVFMELLSNDIFIQHELKHVFLGKPTFSKYIVVDEVYRQVIGTIIPVNKEWSKLCMYQD